MKIKTVTWNIGGAKLLTDGHDPGLLASYNEEGLDTIVERLRTLDADIITLQEVEGDRSSNQIETISRMLDYDHWLYDPVSASHLSSGQYIGNGIISKHPLSDHKTGFFYNPNIEFDLEGELARTHDKGYTQGLVNIGGVVIRVTALHLMPFRRANIELDSVTAADIYKSVVDEVLTNDEHILIQGDFNMDSPTIGQYIPTLFGKSALSEIVVDRPTTPKNRAYDHALFKGLSLVNNTVDSSIQTDHYPVICEFELYG